ncbi:hypothetical protein EDB19DRAFT_1751299, partial [Suillus lakei]
MPHLAVSTAMFMLLFILTVVAHLRRGKRGELTLINIAAAMHGSELPALFPQMKADVCDGSRPFGVTGQEDVSEIIGDRNII